MKDRVLVTGASGLLGSSVATRMYESGTEVLGVKWTSMSTLPFPNVSVDLTRRDDAINIVMHFRPTVILHAAALSKVLECEHRPNEAEAQNVGITENMLLAGGKVDSYFVFISTDQVFDGKSGNYSENEAPNPTHIYGKTKRQAERLVSEAADRNLIARSNNIVGRNTGSGRSFTDGLLESLVRSEEVKLFVDQIRSPIHLRMISSILMSAIRDRLSGTLHVGGPEALSRYETGIRLARAYGLPSDLVKRSELADHPDARLLHRDGSFNTLKLRNLYPEFGEAIIGNDFAKDASAKAND